MKYITKYNNYPTKISTILLILFINPVIYNSYIYNGLYSTIPLSITSFIYHILEYKKIIILDQICCLNAFIQFSYFSYYYTNNYNSNIAYINVVFTYIVCKLLSNYYKSYFWKLHAFMHLLLIPSTIILIKNLNVSSNR